MGFTRRETVIAARTTGTTAGTFVVDVINSIGRESLDTFRDLLLYWEVTQGMVGTTPELRLAVQRAIVPDPVQATDGHWDDLFVFDEITTTAQQRIAILPAAIFATAVTPVMGWDRATGGLADYTGHPGLYGDRLRIVEIISGSDLTQAAIYSLHLNGMA